MVFLLHQIGKLNFLWAHNRVAIIEQETKDDYLTYQYMVQNGWNLLVCKNEKVNPEDPTWTLKRIEPSGKLIALEGKRKLYQDKDSKNPKINQ